MTPTNQYEPEVLLLAPAGNPLDDANMLSLVSQLLELGVAVELDENWRLPTVPPKPLEAYKVCLFPESARAQYDKDLDAYYLGGGWLPYFKYYPDDDGVRIPGVHHFYQSYGRDAYMFHAANVALESGVRSHHAALGAQPGWADTLARRALPGMIAAYRAHFFSLHEGKSGAWFGWGDPAYTQLINVITLAQKLDDQAWLALAANNMERMAATVPEFIRDRLRFQEIQLPGASDNGPMIHAENLMHYGEVLGKPAWVDAGIRLAWDFVAHGNWAGDVVRESWMRLLWSECAAPVPALFALARYDGDRRMGELAERMLRVITGRNQAPNGLWYHWTNDAGERSAIWSRGVMWPVLWMAQSLLYVDHGSAIAAFMLDALRKSYAGLAQVQDPASGLWHLVMDEPETRLESSAAADLVYSHDLLRRLGLLDDRYDGMMARAFEGLKRLWYGYGLASNCRGTSTGAPAYYRTRPMGFYANTLFPATMAQRVA